MLSRGAGGQEVLEVDSIPGLTDTSLLPMATEAAGLALRGVRPPGARAGWAAGWSRLAAEPLLLGQPLPRNVRGDDEEGLLADVAEAVSGVFLYGGTTMTPSPAQTSSTTSSPLGPAPLPRGRKRRSPGG